MLDCGAQFETTVRVISSLQIVVVSVDSLKREHKLEMNVGINSCTSCAGFREDYIFVGVGKGGEARILGFGFRLGGVL